MKFKGGDRVSVDFIFDDSVVKTLWIYARRDTKLYKNRKFGATGKISYSYITPEYKGWYTVKDADGMCAIYHENELAPYKELEQLELDFSNPLITWLET